MALDLVDYEHKVHEAVKLFWRNREAARQKQIEFQCLMILKEHPISSGMICYVKSLSKSSFIQQQPLSLRQEMA